MRSITSSGRPALMDAAADIWFSIKAGLSQADTSHFAVTLYIAENFAVEEETVLVPSTGYVLAQV